MGGEGEKMDVEMEVEREKLEVEVLRGEKSDEEETERVIRHMEDNKE